jgi:hypothetical protein
MLTLFFFSYMKEWRPRIKAFFLSFRRGSCRITNDSTTDSLLYHKSVHVIHHLPLTGCLGLHSFLQFDSPLPTTETLNDLCAGFPIAAEYFVMAHHVKHFAGDVYADAGVWSPSSSAAK